MNEALFLQYCRGWETGSVSGVLSLLHEDIFIEECYGPEYRGKDQVNQWMRGWLLKNKVISWKVKQVFVENDRLSAEWNFCFLKPDGSKRSFDGASFVSFKDNKISSIQEYWQTKE